MTLVELDNVVGWIEQHLREFIYDDWNAPISYNEEEEVTKALRIFFEGEK